MLMPKKPAKPSEILAGNSSLNAEMMTIQKSLPMLALWRSPLTLPEFKILDLYLARIDSRKPDQRWVRFEKGELEDLLGVQYIKPNELKRRLRNLCTVVELPNLDNPDGFRAISLFESAICVPDENGVWQVDLQCTPSAMEYIFNVENIGYLRYSLHAICHLNSRHSYILFLYLERNRFRGTWEEGLDVLRMMLSCETDYYQSYKRFNQHILKPCCEEILEKTECRFAYNPVKRGRTVVKIQFTVYPEPDENETSQIPESEQEVQPVIDTASDDVFFENPKSEEYVMSLIRSACYNSEKKEPDFSDAEIKHMLQYLRRIPTSMLPWVPAGGHNFAIYHYLVNKYTAMLVQDAKKPIRNRFAYMMSIIKNDSGDV